MPAIPFRQGRTRRHFMLMPLVDVIFLLLTFFMLSSQISPFAVLPVGAGEEAAQASAADPQANAFAGMLVAVSAGIAQVNGEAMSFEAFEEKAKSLRAGADGVAVVLPRRAASVQDVIAVLEILRRAQFTRVSIRTRDAP